MLDTNPLFGWWHLVHEGKCGSVRNSFHNCFKWKALFISNELKSVYEMKWEGLWWSGWVHSQGSQRALTYCVCCSVYISPLVALRLKGVSVNLYLSSALSLSVGGQWRNPGHDGERPDSQGPGGCTGLCPAGEPHQRGGVHREPPQALQGEPHLCKSCCSCSIHT